MTNERSGKEDDNSSVACTVMDVSAQLQFGEGSAPRKTAEGIGRQQLQSRSGGSGSRSGSSVARSGS